MKCNELKKLVNSYDYRSLQEFSRKTNFTFKKAPIDSQKIGYSLIETYAVECEDGIVNIKGSAVAGPEWIDFGIGYIIAY